MNTSNQWIEKAVKRILEPLVRLILRHGLSFNEFSDMAKQVFVEVAEQDFALPGKKQTTSRIAVITGLHRKDVASLREHVVPDNVEQDARHVNRARRVALAWMRESEFLDEHGNPKVLPVDALDEPNFNELAKRYSGDMPVRAILDELLRTGVVVIENEHFVSLNTAGYVPQDSLVEKMEIGAAAIRDLANTVEHNLQTKGTASRLQLSVSYRNLSPECLPMLRKMAEQGAKPLLKDINQYLGSQEQTKDATLGSENQYRAGVGIYLFEEQVKESGK